MKPIEAVLVAHTHWDREWYLPFQQFRARLVGVVDYIMELLERDERFTSFTLDGQSVILEDYLEIRPENQARLRALVGAGRLVAGPWYVLPDEFLTSEEAILRNLLLGQVIARRFGHSMDVGHVPDPFGHIGQLPQILRGFGIESAMFSRGMGDEGETLGAEFRWRGPDGSEVLGCGSLSTTAVSRLRAVSTRGSRMNDSVPKRPEARVGAKASRAAKA